MPKHTKEDQEILEEAMNYAYLIVTGKATFDDLVETENEVMLPYNILGEEDVDFRMLIDYFEDVEDYEKCAELLILAGMEEIKNKKNN
tara:strand:+ start:3014 stop:3277 length:264 start_codon:yes stop_codon:yes gene_type:complete